MNKTVSDSGVEGRTEKPCVLLELSDHDGQHVSRVGVTLDSREGARLVETFEGVKFLRRERKWDFEAVPS